MTGIAPKCILLHLVWNHKKRYPMNGSLVNVMDMTWRNAVRHPKISPHVSNPNDQSPMRGRMVLVLVRTIRVVRAVKNYMADLPWQF